MRLISICVEVVIFVVYFGVLCVMDLEIVMMGLMNLKVCVVGGDKGVCGMCI